MSEKQAIVAQSFQLVIKAIYFAFGAFWLFFPVLIIIAAMDVFPFLLELGRNVEKLQRDYFLLVSFAEAVFLCNIVFLIWHIFIKGHRRSMLKQESIYKNKIFSYLSLICNVALAWMLLVKVFTPIY